MKPGYIPKVFLPMCLVAFSATAWTDVTLQQSVKVEAGGGMSVMNSTGTVTTAVSGNRGRTENSMEMASKLMKKFAKNLNTATIVLLDDEKMLNLMPEERKYSEVTFEQMRQKMEQGMAQMEEMQGGGLPVSEEECEWSEPVVDVQKTRNSEAFAGVKARQTIITATQSCTVPDTGKSCDMKWALEFWNAKKIPGEDEARAFQEGMAKAMGGDELLALAKVNTQGLLGMFKDGWEEVLSESGDLKGYPVKTVMSLEMGGEQCTTPAGQPIAMDDIWSEAGNAALDAAAGTAASHAGSAVGQQAAEAVGDSVGGSVAGSAIGAASQKLIGGALGKFRNRKKDQEPKAEAANPAAGSVTLFKVTTELTGISDEDIADNQFQVPEGWQKVDSNAW
ncbi:MAG: hypothetical protein V2I48_17405 [Xanthomonadales bacterium]|nr:hypothetical protein [Xanthomonadales bacterium]